MEGSPLLLAADYCGEWVESPKSWTWHPKSKVTIPIIVTRQVSYDELVEVVISSGDLMCEPAEVIITYMLSVAPSREKTAPSFIKTDNDLRSYFLDVGSDGSRPTLRIMVAERSQEGSNAAGPVNNLANLASAAASSPAYEFNTDSPFNNFENENAVENEHEDAMEVENANGNVNGNEDEACIGHVETENGNQNDNVNVDQTEKEEEEDGDEDEAQDEDEFTHPASSHLLGISGGANSSHSYDDETGFYIGQTFGCKRALVVKLKMAAVKKNFSFKTLKSSRKLLSVRCVEGTCLWRLRAMRYIESDTFYITKYNRQHTCGVQHVSSHHPHASADVIAEYVKPMFVDSKGPCAKVISSSVRQGLSCNVSYWKAWKGGVIAKSLVRGTHKHAYEVIDAYRYMLETTNQGSITDLRLDVDGIFMYCFVAVGACIRGFEHIRKVIAVDGTFLTGESGGVLLSAVGQDTEGHIYPVAFCVVDKECNDSWLYFFEQLLGVVPNTSELCIISDRHLSIAYAISRVYTEAHHGYCIRHLAENIRLKFRCGAALKHYYAAANAYTGIEFGEHFVQFRAKSRKAAAYLIELGVEQWTRAYCPGKRYGVMTTNIAESVNAMFKVEREFPITALFNAINVNFAGKFLERRTKFANSTQLLVGSAEKMIRDNMQIGNAIVAKKTNEGEFEVVGHNSPALVNLVERRCTCREFDLEKLPCPHAMAALRVQYGPEFGSSVYAYSSPYYLAQNYTLAYAEPIFQVPAEEYWMLPEGIELRQVDEPAGKRLPGRKRTVRVPSAGEPMIVHRGKRRNRCSLCKRCGHKKTTCPSLNSQGA